MTDADSAVPTRCANHLAVTTSRQQRVKVAYGCLSESKTLWIRIFPIICPDISPVKLIDF